MFSIDAMIEERFPAAATRPSVLSKTLVYFLRHLCHEREFKQFEENYPHLEGFDFVEQALKYFNFGYQILDHHLERIPVQGRVVIVANHPIGSLDGLALLKMVAEIRRDVKVVANELLYQIQPLRSLLLPVDNMGGHTARENLRAIRDHLDTEGALIIFPAGEVSRFGPTGIKDGHWHNGFLRFADRADAPVLPIYVDGRNSVFFYSLSLLAKPISTLWLIREMFKQANNHVDIRVGHQVAPEEWRTLGLDVNRTSKLFRRHVYQIGKGKRTSLFAEAQEAIAHPENRQVLKREIQHCESLGRTADGMQICLYHYSPNSAIMREIGRLRELTFRHVKEGTGLRRDTDGYDRDYEHIVLWDESELEIVGAYRVAPVARLLREGQCQPPLYTQTLFDFAPEFTDYFERGLELGRSFVQPRYWSKRSLDYLWYGIGAYLRARPNLRYLFGPVSLSGAFPAAAKDLMVNYYRTHYGAETPLVKGRTPYQVNSSTIPEDFASLKRDLATMGQSVPTLYKQYSELCEPGGVQFFDFNVDKDFGDCIDGLILVDLAYLKTSRRKRYISENLAA